MKDEHISDTELRRLVAGVLRLRPEDWGDEDAPVLFARVLRLEARLEAMERHHQETHPTCAIGKRRAGRTTAPQHELAAPYPPRQGRLAA
jgi:hypothetical protein